MTWSTVLVYGAPFAAITTQQAANLLVDRALEQEGVWINAANLDSLRKFRTDHVARGLITTADLVVADGAPLVWASRLAGCRLPERVAGSTVIYDLAAAAADRRASIYMIGGDPGMAEATIEVLGKRNPGLRVVGSECPPMGFDAEPAQVHAISERVRSCGADIVLVAMGFPKQDLLIKRLREAHPSASYMGVGITFSFVGGGVRRAPMLLQQLGLEWLWRLSREPRKLARRYLVEGVPFALRMMASAFAYRLQPRKNSRGRPLWGRV